MLASKQQYLNWQKQLASNSLFKRWWQFWAIYSFVFFAVAFLYILVQTSSPNIDWRKVAALAVLSFVLARGVVVTTINFFYHHIRPYQKFQFTPISSVLFSIPTRVPNSFPSRHTISYMSVAVVVLMFFPWIGLGLVLTSLLAGVGRVVLGYHWPSDIAAGAVLGAILAVFTVIYIAPTLFT